MNHYPLFWMRSNNLGDALNPVLYRAITGREPIYSEDSPKIVAVGSVIHKTGPGDLVWGAGCISKDHPLNVDETTRVCTVRGPLTAWVLKECGLDVPPIYGDPTLLLPRFFTPHGGRKTCRLGVIRHYADASIPLPLPDNSKLLSVMFTDPLGLVAEICSCRVVVSSSLHGIVVAEAYGIPAVWVELSDNVVGEGFKFRDYYLGTCREGVPLDWRDGPDWEEALILAESWKPPEFDADGLLAACPFDWEVKGNG